MNSTDSLDPYSKTRKVMHKFMGMIGEQREDRTIYCYEKAIVSRTVYLNKLLAISLFGLGLCVQMQLS